MKTKIIILLVISSLIIGCVENQSPFSKTTGTKNIINFTAIDITKKLIIECGSTLTTNQCDDWVENQLNNKYVNWSGTVSDVKGDLVYVQYQPKDLIIDKTRYGSSLDIVLHDIDKNKLMQLQRGQSIRYIGMIKPEKIEGLFNGDKSYKNWWKDKTESGELNLYDSEIID